jgi:hypothetical protein
LPTKLRIFLVSGDCFLFLFFPEKKNVERNTKELVNYVCHVLEHAILIAVARLPIYYGNPDRHKYAVEHPLLTISTHYDIIFKL